MKLAGIFTSRSGSDLVCGENLDPDHGSVQNQTVSATLNEYLQIHIQYFIIFGISK